ncbi:MAG: hypothetical protein HY273_17440 [Gammaproteobacteria bacterium]|nr:hypothetical protein [Gammaproteobacteria bacterium]
MSDLLLEPTSTAQWRQLVTDAQSSARQRLDEELESYLVFLLMRFTHAPQVVMSIVALDYLECQLAHGKVRHERLREVGDRCLLFSGLFPQLAQRRHVSADYYVNIGQGAYAELSGTLSHSVGSMYRHLAQGFVLLMDVLQNMRRLGSQQPLLDPLHALELWSRTGSRSAWTELQAASTGTPIVPENNQPH